MSPQVSICVPNLNTRPYLPERFETIFNQTLQDWELIVYDSFSNDGAWEYIRELAVREPRTRISQGPRDGIYPGWNVCIRQARGEYIYIATSDDTMAPDCLEKLVAALTLSSQCGLAHCRLVVIDEAGQPRSEDNWPHGTAFGVSAPELLQQAHIRYAPLDGVLHLTGQSVYLSITGLLIRRTLFSKVGNFRSDWGSSGDINWAMRAGLVANTVHVPDTWASWRRHASQATKEAVAGAKTDWWERRIEDMIEDALRECASYLHPSVRSGLESHWIGWCRDLRQYYSQLRHRPNLVQRRLFQLTQLIGGTSAGRREIVSQFCRKPQWTERVPLEMRRWLESLGIGPVITRVA